MADATDSARLCLLREAEDGFYLCCSEEGDWSMVSDCGDEAMFLGVGGGHGAGAARGRHRFQTVDGAWTLAFETDTGRLRLEEGGGETAWLRVDKKEVRTSPDAASGSRFTVEPGPRHLPSESLAALRAPSGRTVGQATAARLLPGS